MPDAGPEPTARPPEHSYRSLTQSNKTALGENLSRRGLSLPEIGLQFSNRNFRCQTMIHKMFPKAFVFFLVLSVTPANPVFAGSIKEFQLKDGSVIQAEILSYSNGIYQVKSKTLGKLKLPDNEIDSILFPGNKSKSRSNTSKEKTSSELTLNSLGVTKSDLQGMEQKILNDPGTVELLNQLKNDPSMQSILKDKALMDAVNKGDLGAVAQDPKIKSLMNNRTVGEILDRSK